VCRRRKRKGTIVTYAGRCRHDPPVGPAVGAEVGVAELGEHLAEHGVAALADLDPPALLQRGRGGVHCAPSTFPARGAADQLRAPVLEVRNDLHVAAVGELRRELAEGLLGDPGPCGELGDRDRSRRRR
jgi:hypothetical protein